MSMRPLYARTVIVCAAALAFAGCGSNAGVTPLGGMTTMAQVHSAGYGPGWVHKDGLTFSTPHYMLVRNRTHPAVSGVLFSYGFGPVLVTPHIYVIFWGYKTVGDPDNVAKLVVAYLKSAGGSGHNNIYTQYYDVQGGKDVYITNAKPLLKGVWFDQTNAVPASPTDAEVAVEADQGVAKFGYDANAAYIVATPQGHSSSGFGVQWCGYHSNTFYGGNVVSYINLPYVPDGGTGCGSNATLAPKDETSNDEGVTIVLGHEQGEAVTDPNQGMGWYNYTYGEIGDACAWFNIQNDPFGNKSYTMQPMYSNASKSCVHSY